MQGPLPGGDTNWVCDRVAVWGPGKGRVLCHPAPSHSPSHAFCECPLNCVLGVRNRADLFWVNTFWVNGCGTTSLRYDEVLHKRVTHPEAEIPEGDLGAEQRA